MVDDAEISAAAEVVAMRAAAEIATAAASAPPTSPAIRSLVPASALLRMGDALPPWYPTVFLGELEPFRPDGRMAG